MSGSVPTNEVSVSEGNLKPAPMLLTAPSLVFRLAGWPGGRLGGQDDAEYSCQSTANCQSGAGAAQPRCEGVASSTHLSVQFPPTNLTLSHTRLTLLEGGGGVVECRAAARPAARYRWEGRGRVLGAGHTLTLTNVTRQQAGSFTCHASNQHGTARAELQLTVNHAPDCRVQSIVAGVGGGSWGGSGGGIAGAGLECSATATPATLSFQWSGAGNISLVSLPATRNSSRLAVMEPGTYTCAVANTVGTSICSYTGNN